MADAGWPGGRLPRRGVLLHIGPHKTGTTTIQTALAAARPALYRCGIVYPGLGERQRLPALAVIKSANFARPGAPPPADWEQLVADVRAARRRRVVISSEEFVTADDQAIRRIVDGLGDERVHVVVTVRPLANIVPSAWQQAVRHGLRMTYDEWLDVLFHGSEHPAGVAFWRRHRHADLVERWAAVVGRERVAVIVGDDSDRQMLIRSFEGLLDLPDGSLVAKSGRDNRGLTAAEVELVRQLNVDFADRGWPPVLQLEVVHRGVVLQMQTRRPDPTERRIVTPRWAVEQANRNARAAAARIRDLDIFVVGNLDSLGAVPVPPEDLSSTTELRLPASAADLAVAGAAARLRRLRLPLQPIGRRPDRVPTREIAAVVARRLTGPLSAMLGLGIRRY